MSARDEVLERFILAQQSPPGDLAGNADTFDAIAADAETARRPKLAAAAREWASMRRSLVGLGIAPVGDES